MCIVEQGTKHLYTFCDGNEMQLLIYEHFSYVHKP